MAPPALAAWQAGRQAGLHTHAHSPPPPPPLVVGAEDALLWVRLDPGAEWLAEVQLLQPERMLCAQALHSRDVVAQAEAVQVRGGEWGVRWVHAREVGWCGDRAMSPPLPPHLPPHPPPPRQGLARQRVSPTRRPGALPVLARVLESPAFFYR